MSSWISCPIFSQPLPLCGFHYPTMVFQQGPTEDHCVDHAPLCLGASFCPLVNQTDIGPDVTCRFNCTCPSTDPANDCNKIVVMLGRASAAVPGIPIPLELCGVEVASCNFTFPWLTPTRLIDCRICDHIEGLVQERHNSIANALELRRSCTSPSICSCLKSSLTVGLETNFS